MSEDSAERLITPSLTQYSQINNLISTLNKSLFAYEMSPTGSGKTYCSLYISQILNMPIFIVCTSQLEDMWHNVTDRYGIEAVIISYDKFIFLDFEQAEIELEVNMADIYEAIENDFEILLDIEEAKASKNNAEIRRAVNNQKNLMLDDDNVTDIISVFKIRSVNNSSHYTKIASIKKHIDITIKMRERIKNGTLFVFDESQKLKNIKKSAVTYHGCNVLRHISLVGGKSRVLYMSATPFDKPFMSSSLLYSLRILDRFTGHDYKNLRVPSKEQEENRINFFGALSKVDSMIPHYSRSVIKMLYENPNETMIHYIKMVPSLETEEDYQFYGELTESLINRDIDMKDKKIWIDMYYYFIAKKILSKVSFRMPKVKKYGIHQDIYNWKCDMYFAKQYKNIRAELIRSVESKATSSSITIKSHALEISKVSEMVRYVLKYLQEIPNCKIVIVLKFIKSVYLLYQFLEIYNPALIIGKISVKQRNKSIKLFQEPNLICRIVICIQQVACNGIDLSDVHGGFPRIGFLSPDFHNVELIQACGRLMRQNTKSNSIAYIIFGLVEQEDNDYNQDLENIISRYNIEKSLVIKNLLCNAISYNDKKCKEILYTTENLPSIFTDIKSLKNKILSE